MKIAFLGKNKTMVNGQRLTPSLRSGQTGNGYAVWPFSVLRLPFTAAANRYCLLLLIICPVVLSAQTNGVTVSDLAMDAGTVTFNVGWNKAGVPAAWSDTVWVFVDYNHNGAMERVPLSAGATLTAHTAPGVGKVIEVSGNNKGVWVVGNARTASSGSFSATVKLLTATTFTSGACAYGSNYPPVGQYKDSANILFTGTPVYDIVIKHTDGSTKVVRSDSDFYVPASYTVQSFSDQTGAPGCIMPVIYTLQASAAGFCTGSAGVTFALSGTEQGRKYQLYRDNAIVGTVLTGMGGAATFSGAFNTAGTYTARSEAGGVYCARQMSGSHTISEYPLPANPNVFGASRNCPGTVTLSASSSGAVIDWYAGAAGTSTLHTGASYTTPKIEESTTYYVQARVEATGCLSARAPILAEVITEGCCHAPGSTATFSEFNPCATAVTGATWTLTDTREAAYSYTPTYKVKKMPDGHIWMVQDLKFGNKCNKTTFAGSENKDQTGNVTSLTDKTYYGDCRNNSQPGAGYLYDWAAAINKSGAYFGSAVTVGCRGAAGGISGTNPGACQGICPSGWHLPTGLSNGEFNELDYAMISAYGCSGTGCWNPSSPWEGVLGGNCSQSGAFIEQGAVGYYSSSSDSGLNMYAIYSLYFFAQGTEYEAGTSISVKNRGLSVRCVMNY